MAKFGIEIEFQGSQRKLMSVLSEAGFGGTSASYSSFSTEHWVVKSDGSVTSGGELVSPPLEFTDPAQRGQVDAVVKLMREQAECVPDTSAGIHVHIDGTNMDPAQIKYLVRLWTKFEDPVIRIASSGWDGIRSGGRWCMPLRSTQVERLAAGGFETLEDLARAWNGPRWQPGHGYSGHEASGGEATRYTGLNLQSYLHRRTVEFRVFNSSVNEERIQGYIAMCHAFMEAAKKKREVSIRPNYILPVGTMRARQVNGERDTEYENAVMTRFTRMLSTQGGLQPVDAQRLRDCWEDSVPQMAFSR